MASKRVEMLDYQSVEEMVEHWAERKVAMKDVQTAEWMESKKAEYWAFRSVDKTAAMMVAGMVCWMAQSKVVGMAERKAAMMVAE